MKTLLYISKAQTPAPAAKTAPAKPPKAPKVEAPTNPVGRPKGDGIEWDYYSGPGVPPPEGGYSQSPSGKWRRPKGSGPGREPAQEDEEGKEPDGEQAVADAKVKEAVRQHDPQDETDPLKNDDGSKPGEEQLTPEEGSVPLEPSQFATQVTPHEPDDGSTPLDPNQFSTQVTQDAVLDKIAESEGPVNVKEVRSVVEAHMQGQSYAGKKSSKKMPGQEASIPSAKADADNFRDKKKPKAFTLPKRKPRKPEPEVNESKTRDFSQPPSAKTEPASSHTGEQESKKPPVDPYAKTQASDPGEVKASPSMDEKTAERRKVADSKRKVSSTKDIKETKKRAEAHVKAKERHERNKASSAEKLSKLKEKRQIAKKASSDNDKEVKSIGKDLDKTRKELKSAEKGSFEHKQATKKLDDLNRKLMVANAKSVGHKQSLSDLDEKEAKIKQGLKDSKDAISAAESAHAEMKDHHGKEIPESASDKILHKDHTEKAKEKLKNIEAHIDQDPDNEDLWSLRDIYAEQASIEHIPSSEDKAALSRGDSYAKKQNVDRHPDQIKADADAEDAKQQAATFKESEKQRVVQEKAEEARAKAESAQQQKDAINKQKNDKKKDEKEAKDKARGQSTSNIMSAYNSGAGLGSQLGTFGTKGGMTQGVELAAKIPKGAVSAGHHLLSNDKKKDEKEEKPEEDPTKKKDVVGKSMKLYIRKAIGQTPNASVDSDKTADQNEEDYEESYDKRSAGTMGGSAAPDLPGKGRKMNAKKSGSKK